MNKALSKHKGDVAIRFHTHSKATGCAHSFSDRDLENIREDPNMYHMLVTPETILAQRGDDEVSVAVE
jgi:hypothetical protein